MLPFDSSHFLLELLIMLYILGLYFLSINFSLIVSISFMSPMFYLGKYFGPVFPFKLSF
jgi:hypothetical protein